MAVNDAPFFLISQTNDNIVRVNTTTRKKLEGRRGSILKDVMDRRTEQVQSLSKCH